MRLVSRFVSLTVPLLILAGAACGASDEGARAASQEQRVGATIPLREVSALSKMGERFIAVGDRSTTLVSFDLVGGQPVDVKEHKPLPKAGKKGSQYEGVDVDAAGHVIVMSEQGDIVVLSSDLAREEVSTQLDWASVEKLLGGTKLEPNSLGEGIVVLDKGHLIVALEKRPSAIVEFGPEGDAPMGFFPGMRSTEAFVPPEKLVALKVWNVDDPKIPDISDLEIGPDGALWAVTQEGNRVFRFERLLRPEEKKASAREYIELPAQISGAEGLAFDGAQPVIGRDRPGEKTNLYVLDAIAFEENPDDSR